MQVELRFKTPDVLVNAAEEAGLTPEQEDQFRDEMTKYVKWGECVTLIWDTETKSFTVKGAA